MRYAPAHPGGVFWLTAGGGPQARDEQWRAIAAGLDLPVAGETDMAVIEGRLRRHLETFPPYLWVVDDLPSDASAEILRGWLAPTGKGCSLVTTRGTGLSAVGTVLTLDVLSQDEAYRLLASHRQLDPSETAAAKAIVEVLGGHALAVDVAGAALLHMSCDEFLEKLRNPGRDALELAKTLSGVLPNGHEAGIAATLLSSIGRLTEDARRVLRLASILAPAPIPRALVAAAFSDPDAALIAAAQAGRESLVQTAPAEILVHALVGRTMRFHDPAERSLRHAAIAAVAAVMPGVVDIRNHDALQDWVTHARVLSEDADDLETADLLGWVARYNLERGAYRAAEAGYRREREVRARLAGEEHPDALTAANNFAFTLRVQDDLAGARALQEQVLAVRRRVLGDEHPDTLTSMSNLAETLRAQGDLAAARVLQEQVLSARGRVLGGEHPDTLTAMGNLAGTLLAQGDLAEARALQEQELSARRRIHGDEHPDTLTAMGNLAGALQAQGDGAKARALQELVLSLRRRCLGDEHPDTLTAMNNLADTLRSLGDFVGARELQERTLAVCRWVLGDEHTETLALMSNLAATLREQNDLVGARELQEHVLSVHRRVLGDEHPETLTSINNLASTLKRQGGLGDARALQEQVLSARRRVLGEEHPNTLTSMSNLADTLRAQGDLAGARALQERALIVLRRVLGEEHPDTFVSMNNLATTLWTLGEAERAQSLLEDALARCRRKLGEGHPTTLSLARNLAAMRGDGG